MLLRQKSNSTDMLEVHADIEEYFTADSGHSTIVPLGLDWNTVGIQLSGGLDSALLLFLTATAIQKHNLNIKIQPVSVFIPTKVKNIASTEEIINVVRARTGADFINDGLVFDMTLAEANPQDGSKDRYFADLIHSLFVDGKINFEYNGNTMNPPDAARVGWNNDEYRQKNRDHAGSIYNSTHSASPHYGMDKADIINMYIKYDLLDDLAPLTCSCDENIQVVHDTECNVPCGTCWWCRERAYGFSSNNVQDPAPVLTYDDYLNTPLYKSKYGETH